MKRKEIGNFVMSILFLLTSLSFSEDIKTIEIGTDAPNFRLLGIDDEYYSLESFNDAEILVIIFTANHCPTAQAYEDRIIKLVNDYKDKNVSVVAISSNNPQAVRLDEMGYTDLGDSFEEMKIRAKQKGFNFPYLYDGDDQIVLREFGALATPHVFIFDKSRKLRFTGRIDDSENIKKVKTHDTRNAIEALLADTTVPAEKTRAFGCSMKWASKQKGAEEAVDKWNAEKVDLKMMELDEFEKLLNNDTDKLLLINFWATWCGPCVSEFPELIEINRMYRNREFEMITVSLDSPDKKSNVLKFLEGNYASNKNFLYNSEDKYALMDKVDKDWPGAIPYTILIEPGGKIIYKKLGMIDPLEVKTQIVEYVGRYYN